MKGIKDLFCEVAERILEKVIVALKVCKVQHTDDFDLCLNAYNLWCESERDGVGYIFDITNKEDLKCLVENDVNATEIADMVCGGFQYCMYDISNKKTLKKADVIDALISSMEQPIKCMLMYAPRCGGDSAYTLLYERFVTEILQEEDFLNS
jgi:hypothetical protein